jgi:hypothetical protein
LDKFVDLLGQSVVPIITALSVAIAFFATMKAKLDAQTDALKNMSEVLATTQKTLDNHIQDGKRHVDDRVWDMLWSRLDRIERMLENTPPRPISKS